MDNPDTIFSLSEELPRALDEDEHEDRARLQPGSIGRGSLRDICFIRKITPRGAVISLDSEVTPGDRLDLALLTGESLAGTVAWVDGRDVGLAFDEPADIFALISRNLVRQPGDARRMPRIELACQGWLEAGSRHEVVQVGNVSDGGACIETRVPLVVHEQIVLTLDGFRPAPGIVRWVDGRAAGIAFTPELSWQELMPWLREVHRRQLAEQADREKREAAPPAAPERGASRSGGGVSMKLAARVREGSRRWSIEVESIDTHQIRFRSYGSVETGRLFWVTLPGLEGWPARVMEVDGYVVTCAFTQPLHPAVLERVLAAARG